MLVYGECECFVMQMVYVCVLCASCGSSQCCVLHDLQFVNAGRGCNRRPYRRGTTLSPLDLWTDPAGVTALLGRWTEKLAGGPQEGTSDSPH